ncbi:hypothetical protein V6N11_034185 [Hibiscus sabdariffa]|uniref:Uncharacterized protein n=1 Tax=Hibiscus sabdariffa TaxID=183260 RepID=A0ABR2S2D1_9ROSI
MPFGGVFILKATKFLFSPPKPDPHFKSLTLLLTLPLPLTLAQANRTSGCSIAARRLSPTAFNQNEKKIKSASKLEPRITIQPNLQYEIGVVLLFPKYRGIQDGGRK